jgi:TnpA family transposase
VASIERTAYPRFKRYYTVNELEEIYTPTKTEITFAKQVTTGTENYFTWIVLLKIFQRLGYFPKMADIPLTIIEYVHTVLNLPEEMSLNNRYPPTLSRHRKAIRAYLQVTPFNQKGRELITKIIDESALRMDNPADLINVAIEELIKNRYELPGFNSLDRLVNYLKNEVNQKIFAEIVNRLNPEQIQNLQNLFNSNTSVERSPYQDLKKLPHRPSRNHLNDLIAHLTWLETLGEIAPLLHSLTRSKIKHFTAEARALTASEMKDIKLPKRLTLLLCLIYSAQVQTRDYLVEMFIKQMKKISIRATEELQSIKEKQQITTEKLVLVLTDILQVFNGESVADESAKQNTLSSLEQLQTIFTKTGGVEHLLSECEEINAYQGNNHLPLMWRFYKSHRRTFHRIFKALKIESTSSDRKLIEAIEILHSNSQRRGEWLGAEVDLSFASQQWQKMVLVKTENVTKVMRRHFEVCIFSYLAAELKSGDVYVKGSEAYADYREQLLSWSDCQPLVEPYCQQLGLPNQPDDFVENLKNLLTQTATAVDLGYPSSTAMVISEGGEAILKRSTAQVETASLKKLEALISERMPERNLIDILRDVDYWTNFTRHFGPLSGSDPKIERAIERYLLTTFTYGCNLGAAQAARHMRGIVTPKMLTFVNQRHISLKGLNAALVDIINRYNVMPLTKSWGDGTTAAADGTKYDLYEQNLISEYHIRYGGYGGIAYHHVADTYIALFSHFIPCGTWEAVYIIEGLLKNKSDIQPQIIHADTQGQSTPVFALSYLLGIELMPRIRNWQDLVFYRPEKETVYQHIDSLFKGVINWELIKTHWSDLMRVVLSIESGQISSDMLLRKLGNYSRKNKLYQAFRELGRVIRTIFLLKFISDQKLRQQITATTNKVEAYNGFSKWFFFGGEMVIASNDPEQQEKIIKYGDLIANAVIFRNVVDLSDVLLQLKKEGFFWEPEDLAALSPYLTSHIKRFGDYLIDLDNIPAALEEQLNLSF